MKEARYFFDPEAKGQTAGYEGALPAEESAHAARVLRLQAGEEIFVMDGAGAFLRATLTLVSPKKCLYRVAERVADHAQRETVTLAIAPTKNIDRMEWLAEKATEVGIAQLLFLDCRFSERRQLRTDRIEKIVLAAAKQSRKAWLPSVEGMTAFDTLLARELPGRRIICHCYNEIPRRELVEVLRENRLAEPVDDSVNKPAEPVVILVGPEGDFSLDEVTRAIACGYESVSLGNARLRTETAGLVAVVTAHLAEK